MWLLNALNDNNYPFAVIKRKIRDTGKFIAPSIPESLIMAEAIALFQHPRQVKGPISSTRQRFAGLAQEYPATVYGFAFQTALATFYQYGENAERSIC